MPRASLTCVALAAAALALPSLATAHNSPASEYIQVKEVYLPFDVPFPRAQESALLGTVRGANVAGYTIRVAVIPRRRDLGRLTTLWLRPRVYAHDLGEDLRYLYGGRVLVVMPNGFGYDYPAHSSARAYAALASVHVGRGPGGLAAAATAAVRRLLAADRVHARVVAVPSASSRNAHDRVVLAAIAAAGLLLAGAVSLVRRRR